MIPKSTSYWLINNKTGEIVSKSSKSDAVKLRNKLGKQDYKIEYH